MKEINMNRSKYLAILIIALVILVSFISFSTFGQDRKKGEVEKFVGSETCKGCHGDLYDILKEESPHWEVIFGPKIPFEKKGCEFCHGQGEKHAESEGKGFITTFKREGANERSEVCLKCHQKQKEFFKFRRGVHKLDTVACNDCHKIMGHRLAKKLLKAKETDLCFSCHQAIKSKFYLPTRHKVLEGAMQCTDCHTPHGTQRTLSLKRWNKFNDDACFKCHPEKRGPWVFEHLSVETEGCSTCHSPHGSSNRFLLNRRDVRTVCLQCHGQRHFPNFSCINCHTQIHGSNFSSRFLQ